MNIGEANDLNMLLTFLLAIPDPFAPKDPDTARAAAVRLTERAYKALSAGLTPEQVARAWTISEKPGGRPKGRRR